MLSPRPETGVLSCRHNSTLKIMLLDVSKVSEYKTQRDELCEEFTDTVSTLSNEIGDTRLINMDIEMGDCPIAKNPIPLPLKHPSWGREELDELGKAGNLTQCFSMLKPYRSSAKLSSIWRTPLKEIMY